MYLLSPVVVPISIASYMIQIVHPLFQNSGSAPETVVFPTKKLATVWLVRLTCSCADIFRILKPPLNLNFQGAASYSYSYIWAKHEKIPLLTES